MTKLDRLPPRESVPSIASALCQASQSLRQGDLAEAVYWVRVAAHLDDDDQARRASF